MKNNTTPRRAVYPGRKEKFGMSVRWWRVTEYDIECDKCFSSETLYSGDSDRDGHVVQNIPTAIKVAGYHRSHGLVLCDRCFKDFRERGDNE